MRKRLKKNLKGILLGYILAFLIPIWLSIFLVSIIIIFNNTVEKQKRKISQIGIISGYSIRVVLSGLILFFFWTHPHYLPLKEKYPLPYFLLLGSEISLYEKIVGYYENNVSLSDDPFSKEPPREKNGYIYSIGPDGIDNNTSIIYDPTNGVMSRGDIIMSRQNNQK